MSLRRNTEDIIFCLPFKWKSNDKPTAFSHFRLYRDVSLQMFHNRFADRKSQASSLFKSIYFIKTVEYFFLAFLRNPRPSIFHKDIHKVCIDWVNCITKMNIPFFGKFTGIVNKVTYDLFQTCSICVNIDIFIGNDALISISDIGFIACSFSISIMRD